MRSSFTKNLCWWSLYAIAGTVAFPAGGIAAEYGAEIAVGEAYTSNLFLAPPGNAESDWITAIVPRVYVDQVTSQYELQLDYRLQALFYANNSEFNDSYSDLFGRGQYNLIDDRFFVKGLARVTQVNISPTEQLPDNNFNVTDNRSNAFAWEAGPGWQQDLFRNSELDTHFYVGTISYSDDSLQSVTTQRGELRLRTRDQTARNWSYDFYYQFQDYDYDDSGSRKFQRLYLQLGYFLTSWLEPVALVGAENDIANTNGLLDEPYWEVGLRGYARNNTLEAYVGHRYYGPTYRFRWTRTTENSDIWLDYRETQQTAESGALDDLGTDINAGIDPVTGESLTQDPGIDRPGTGVQQLRKRARLEYRLRRYRGETRVYGFWTDDEQVVQPIAMPLGPTTSFVDRAYGAGLGFSWEFGSRTAVSLFGDWTRRELDSDQPAGTNSNDLYRTNIRLRYQLTRNIEVCALAGYQEQSGGTVEWDEVNAALRFKWNFLGRGQFGGRQTGYSPLDCSRVF